MAVGNTKNPAVYRVRKHRPINTALTSISVTAGLVRAVGLAAVGVPPDSTSAGTGGLSQRSARYRQYNAESNSSIRNVVGSPETPYDHSVSDSSNSSAAVAAIRLSNNCPAQKYTSSRLANRHSV